MSDTLVKQLLDINRNYDLSKSIHCTLKEAVKRIEELEDQLRKVVDALQEIEIEYDPGDDSINALTLYEIAREVLAEIEKGN